MKRNTYERSRCLRDIVSKMQQEGHALTKHTAAELIHCDKRTAERVLSHLWLEKHIRIVSWDKIYNNTTPIYRWGQGADAPRPAPIPVAEKQRRHRAKPGVMERQNFNKRARRSVGKEVRLVGCLASSVSPVTRSSGDCFAKTRARSYTRHRRQRRASRA